MTHGSMLGLLHDSHAGGCDGKEFCTVETAPYGRGFAVVYAEWCGDCGARDYDIVDFVEPEGPQ
jgi:hypothetical protein